MMTGESSRKRVHVALACGLLLAANVAVSAVAAPPAPITVYTVNGKPQSTAQFKGRRTLLWLLSTWCGSCAAGLHTLAAHAADLHAGDLRVVILRNYRNGGYPGPNIRDFVARMVPSADQMNDWTLGEATKALERAYNLRGYPDVYFLIDAEGRIQAAAGAPSATIDRILKFARQGRQSS